jgi:hypothetical protein
MEIAANTKRYTDDVTLSSGTDRNHPAPLIGDIEPYPSIPVATLISWVDIVSKMQVRLTFFHLDIDLNYLHAHPEVSVTNDIHQLQKFLRQKGIPFGVIIWSGRDPVDSDAAYFEDAMELVRLVKASVRLPSEIVFQSWVRRSPVGCGTSHDQCGPNRCSPLDPSYCGEKSIPLNLPEGDPKLYSHTKLVNDSLAVLGH